MVCSLISAVSTRDPITVLAITSISHLMKILLFTCALASFGVILKRCESGQGQFSLQVSNIIGSVMSLRK